MRTFFAIIVSLLLVVLQLAVLPRLSVLTVVPNLVLAYVLSLAIDKTRKNIWLVLAPAWLLDLLGGLPFGLTTLSLCLTYFLIGWLTDRFIKQNNFFSILISSAVGVLFFEVSLQLFLKLWMGGDYFSQFYFFYRLPISLAYQTIIAVLAILFLHKYIFKKSNGGI